MPLKRMAEYNRKDFLYESPDGDEWNITLVDTGDRKYIELQKQGEETVNTWDVDMFLDIADAARNAMHKQSSVKKRKIKGPNIIDHRDVNLNQPESIQNSVENSMEQSDSSVTPVESFSPNTPSSPESLKEDVEARKKLANRPLDPQKRIKKPSTVRAKDLL